jgi:general stress protein YciG
MAGHAHCQCCIPLTFEGMHMTLQESAKQANPSDTGSSKRSLRGFAAMDPQRQREIASLGGRAAHQSGHAHEFTSEEARAAGKKRHARPSA